MIVLKVRTCRPQRRIVAELVGPGANWLQKLQFPCSEADCRLRHVVGSVEYRPSQHPVKRHREL